MLRVYLALALVTAVAAKVPYVKTREEIQAFREFLDRSQKPSESRVRFNVGHNSKANIEENSGLFEGDILLSDGQKENLVEAFATGSRNGLIDTNYHWPDNTLVYDIAETQFEEMHIAAIQAGFEDLQNVSCIKFRRKNEDDTNFVYITGAMNGCYAHVGFLDIGQHILNLQPSLPGIGCFRHGTVVHELLHSLGFLHMHSSYDRDDWVELIWSNIEGGTENNNFFIYDNETVSHFGEAYDYGSCLHYGTFAFSINGEQTMIPKQEYDGLIGQRIGLSQPDILKLNRYYQCPGHESW